MIIINNKEKFNSINSIADDSFYILTDFDGTITTVNGNSSWSSIFKNPLVSKEFVNECINIFKKYHKYEIDNTLSEQEKMIIMKEWYTTNIDTLIKYKITEEIINYAANNKAIIELRDGAKDFLNNMYLKRIPVIIISAGVGNIIEQFLINNECYFDNIFITSNFMQYNNGIICGVRDNNLIHSLNKNEISLSKTIKDKIQNRNNVILLGDSIADTQMINSENKNVFKIGFLDEKVEEQIEKFKTNYDIICTDNTSYKELSNYVKILSK